MELWHEHENGMRVRMEYVDSFDNFAGVTEQLWICKHCGAKIHVSK